MAIIGIDLGTTNSLVGAWTNGVPNLIPNVHGSLLTPSVVGLDENGDVLIGQTAKERLITHPEMTVANFKRWMGTGRKTKLGKKSFLPEELSALVLRSLVRDAADHLNEKIEEAVISVPAYFNDPQRRATRAAGRLAGLKVERILNEPTAAALAYGLEEEQDSTNLVVDLGGGTFDVTVLERFDDVLQVHSSSGDNHFGGENFKQILSTHLSATHKLDPKSHANALSAVAERIMAALSTSQEADYEITVRGSTIKGRITRVQFEEWTQGLLPRLRVPIERAVRDAKLSLDDLDQVILAGGATRIPFVRREIGKLLKKIPQSHLDPDQVVAMGAVIQASLKERNEDLRDIVLTDVCPFTLGVGAVRDELGTENEPVMSPIIERNATVPISKVGYYQPVSRLSNAIEFTIYQGESLNLDNNIRLGQLEIKVPRGVKKNRGVEVRFTYDINGILEVVATTLETNVSKRLVLNTSNIDISDEEVERRLSELANIKLSPLEREANTRLIARAERLFEELIGDDRNALLSALGQFRSELNDQSLHPSDEKSLQADFSRFLDALDRSVF